MVMELLSGKALEKYSRLILVKDVGLNSPPRIRGIRAAVAGCGAMVAMQWTY